MSPLAKMIIQALENEDEENENNDVKENNQYSSSFCFNICTKC